MFFPSLPPPLVNSAWVAKPQPPLTQHHQLKAMEMHVKRQLASLTATTPNFSTPPAFFAHSNPTGIHLSSYHSRPGVGVQMVVQQDLGMTPVAPSEPEEEFEEDEGEMEYHDGDEFVEEDEDGEMAMDGEDEYGADGGDELRFALDRVSDEEEEEDGDAADPQQYAIADDGGDDPDAALDDMDPEDMDEEEQIRWLQRQHEKEVLARQQHQTPPAAASQQQQSQPRPSPPQYAYSAPHSTNDSYEDDFFDQPSDNESHITPPTRSQRVASTSGSAASGVAHFAAPTSVAPSMPRTRSRMTAPLSSASVTPPHSRGVGDATVGPSTARRTLDLDSSAESMQLETPPRGNLVASAHFSNRSTPSSINASFSEATLAELGMSADDAQALMAEQMMLFEQARTRQGGE